MAALLTSIGSALAPAVSSIGGAIGSAVSNPLSFLGNMAVNSVVGDASKDLMGGIGGGGALSQLYNPFGNGQANAPATSTAGQPSIPTNSQGATFPLTGVAVPTVGVNPNSPNMGHSSAFSFLKG